MSHVYVGLSMSHVYVGLSMSHVYVVSMSHVYVGLSMNTPKPHVIDVHDGSAHTSVSVSSLVPRLHFPCNMFSFLQERQPQGSGAWERDSAEAYTYMYA